MRGLRDYISNEPLRAGMLRVFDAIGSDAELQNLSGQLIRVLYDLGNQDEFIELYNRSGDLLAEKLGSDTDCYLACVFDMGFDRLHMLYNKRKIPESVLSETMTDFDVSAEEYYVENKRAGIADYGWLAFHMQGKLFRLGRLQYIVDKKFSFNTYVFRNTDGDLHAVAKDGIGVDNDGFVTRGEPVFTTEYIRTKNAVTANMIDTNGNVLSQKPEISMADHKCVLAPGDDVLDMHIPSGEKLDIEDCLRSMDRAIVFGHDHFPEFDYKAFTLRSWLLSDEIKEVLSDDANLVRFSNMFTRAAGVRTEKKPHIYKWIFGFDKMVENYKDHAAGTALQRGAHKLLDEGRWFVTRTGIIII